jgi:hypothetical protein
MIPGRLSIGISEIFIIWKMNVGVSQSIKRLHGSQDLRFASVLKAVHRNNSRRSSRLTRTERQHQRVLK